MEPTTLELRQDGPILWVVLHRPEAMNAYTATMGAEIAAAILFLVASVAGKLAGIHLAGRILKWQKGEASIIGWLLQTKALIMIIFVNVLLDKGIITNETFTAMLLMAVASTMLTIPMTKPRIDRLQSLLSKAD